MRYFFFLLVLFVYAVPGMVFAAEIAVSSDFKNFHVGDTFSVDISVDTENEVFNAADITILFPSEFLEFVDYDDGSTALSLWVEKPALTEDGRIKFSGITPGGFSGDRRELLTLEFRVERSGQGNFEVRDSTLLVHDGVGTKAEARVQNLHVTATDGQSEIAVRSVDDELPEAFPLQVVRDPDVFGGVPVLIFATADKGSGIDHFEVKEGWFGRYTEVTSPYQIQHQNLDRIISVKAIDNNGNYRVAVLYPQNQKNIKDLLPVVVIMVVLCSLVFFILRKVRSVLPQK